MIELVRDLRVVNVLAKFENDPWKIMNVRVLTGLACPPAHPLRVRQYTGALRGCGVKKIGTKLHQLMLGQVAVIIITGLHIH